MGNMNLFLITGLLSWLKCVRIEFLFLEIATSLSLPSKCIGYFFYLLFSKYDIRYTGGNRCLQKVKYNHQFLQVISDRSPSSSMHV